MAPSVVLFVAARKGSQQKQKSTLKACDPVVTLRQLAASILGPDAEVGRVEAAAKLGGETTNFTVDDLGYTAHFLQECGLRFIEIVFVDDEPLFVAARAAGASAEQSALTALMREEKRKSVLYYWPALYADSRNCRSTRNVANALITAGMKDPVKYGGFASQTEADNCQSIFWGLAEVLLWAMPHVAKFESRSMPLPQLFVDAALDVYVNSACKPTSDECRLCQAGRADPNCRSDAERWRSRCQIPNEGSVVFIFFFAASNFKFFYNFFKFCG